MGYPAELTADRVVYLLFCMPVYIHPEGRHPVEVAPSVGIDQERAFTPLDDNRTRIRPLLHLGEGMPDILPVSVFEWTIHQQNPTGWPSAAYEPFTSGLFEWRR